MVGFAYSQNSIRNIFIVLTVNCNDEQHKRRTYDSSCYIALVCICSWYIMIQIEDTFEPSGMQKKLKDIHSIIACDLAQ